MAKVQKIRREAVTEPSSIEKNNLETHVELCALRYTALEDRLGKIEKKVGDLQTAVEKSFSSTTKVLIGTAGTVITGVLTTLMVVLTKVH